MINNNQRHHIIVGLSGGVDSAVTAYLLKQAGHRVEALFMKNWEQDDTDTFCPAAQDFADAERVCEQLGIELSLVNFADQYWQAVFSHFLTEYRAGRTPNPDILCNKEIKFRAFLDYAKQRGADYIATGHYVRTKNKNQQTELLKGIDPEKDQSYFLYALHAEQLAQSLFPVGHLYKSQVRALAKELNLQNHAKKDSTGICFIGERKFKTFLSEYLPAQPGNIENLEGKILGRHDGILFYTIGQRRGLLLGGKKDHEELPWYVAAKDVQRNVLIVVQGEQHPALYKNSLRMQNVHWINGITSTKGITAKTRYRQPDQPCTLMPLSNGDYQVDFAEPQRAITPGQSIVFYQEDVCLGGGIIVE